MSEDLIRDAAVRAALRRPGIAEEELVGRVATAAGASADEVRAVVRALAQEGVLEPAAGASGEGYEVAAASPLELARRAEIELINAGRVEERPAGTPARRVPSWALAAAGVAAGVSTVVVLILVGG